MCEPHPTLRFPLTADEIQRELIRRSMHYADGPPGIGDLDGAVRRAAAELELEIQAHYAGLEKNLRCLAGERLQ